MKRAAIYVCQQPDVAGIVCGRPIHSGGYCALHYSRHRDGRDMTTPHGPGTKPVTGCTAEGCTDPAYARNLCNAHYQRLLHGRPNVRPVIRKKTPLAERVNVWLAECSLDGECLVFPRLNSTGYATHVHDDAGRSTSRHRAVYLAVHGELPKWAQVHHTCANRACIKPEHLTLASRRENVGEMLARREYEHRIQFLERQLAEHHCGGCACPSA